MESSMELARDRGEKMRIYKRGYTQKNDLNSNEEFIDGYTLDMLGKELKFIPEELDRDDYLGSYSSFEGSPLSKGEFQFDLWSQSPSDRYDWSSLMIEIQKYGVRNSLLVAPMPTASTARLGNYDVEPPQTNIYSRPYYLVYLVLIII